MRQINVGTFKTTNLMRLYVNDVLDANRISYGNYCRAFEMQFSELHECQYGVLSNSGTSSLQVALQTLKELNGWCDGDEVIIPAITFVATANIVLHNRMIPVLVDVDSDYYAIDASKIESAITQKTRAIIPVHTFGQPCDMLMITAIANRYHLAIVEDSCECMFVSHNQKHVGAWGDVGCFSTYVAHLLTTGVGGIATTNNKDVAAKMRSLVNHGRDGIYISIDDNKQGADQKEVIAKRFKFDSIGHSFRITELEAALGFAQLQSFEEMITTRQANARYLTSQLERFEDYIQLPRIRPCTEHAWMMYPIVLRYKRKDELVEHLENNGIETREMLPLVQQPCYDGMWNPNQYRVANWIDRCGFYIGIHQNLTIEDLNYIVEVMGAYFDESVH